jgi:hypothetical protein
VVWTQVCFVVSTIEVFEAFLICQSIKKWFIVCNKTRETV